MMLKGEALSSYRRCWICLIILGGLALAVLGLLMGIVALLDKRRSKVFALLGVLCSGMVLASVALLLILGAVLG